MAFTLFPQVVAKMADQIAWTRVLGQAFTSDKSAVFASIQKLRLQAKNVGTLKSSPQQEVETKTTSAGQEVIVIEPTNPQIVYVPQYNTEVVYTQAPTSVVVIEEDDDADEAIAAGLIGFTAGIVIGASMDNNYYYGPYGFHGGAYMYNDAWDDYYDHREDAREDWQDHREDLGEERGDRAENRSEQRTERAGTTQEQRTDRQQTRQENRPESQAQRTTPSATRVDPERDVTGTMVRVAPAVPKPAVTATAAEVRQRSRRNGAAARTHSLDIRTENQHARPVLVDNRAEAARAAAAGPTPVSARKRSTHMTRTIALLALLASSATIAAQTATHRAFATPEDAVKALVDTVKAENLDALLAIFGPEGRELVASSDPATARMNRRVFAVAFREQWHLEDATPTQKTLVIGNEDWPFPVPLVKGRRRMAIRHSRRQGRSAGAADRTQRAAGDRDLPCLRHRAAALRARGTRRQARRRARREVPERSRQAERPVLADRARPEAESTW